MLVILLVLAGGRLRLQRPGTGNSFPDITFPNITVLTYYPTADPENSGPRGNRADRGSHFRRGRHSGRSVNLPAKTCQRSWFTFEFGQDMLEAERAIESSVNGIQFPSGVGTPTVSRINNETFPVIQLSVAGDRDIASLQRLLDDAVVPPPGSAERGVRSLCAGSGGRAQLR